MKKFLAFVVGRLVDHPDDIILHDESDAQAFRFKLELERGDVGKIIGRGGYTIGAIRNVLASAAARHGKRVFVDIVERG